VILPRGIPPIPTAQIAFQFVKLLGLMFSLSVELPLNFPFFIGLTGTCLLFYILTLPGTIYFHTNGINT
jgi:hypothetical protein